MTDLNGLAGRRVLITGHTGFKGAWLALWLRRLGAEVYGYALLPPPTDPSVYALARVAPLLAGETAGDLLERERLAACLASVRPELILHLAAQALVLESYSTPYETFAANTLGTASLLEAVRLCGRPCAVVCVTTDKCYENLEQPEGYSEGDPLGGHDPYSASKGAAEIVISSYRRSFFPAGQLARHGVQLASARAGNVIGGGDWARHRLVADAVRARLEDRDLPIRNPHAIRPWQHVLEPLSGYLALGASMLAAPSPVWCDAWNFGPLPGTEATVGQLASAFLAAWGSGAWSDASEPGQPHEAGILKLRIDKARERLGWQPRWGLDETVRRTADWYRLSCLGGADARALCAADIDAYTAAAGRPA